MSRHPSSAWRIVVFVSESDGAVGMFRGVNAKGKPEWLPALVHGATAEQAHANAEAYRRQIAEHAANREAGRVRRAAARATSSRQEGEGA